MEPLSDPWGPAEQLGVEERGDAGAGHPCCEFRHDLLVSDHPLTSAVLPAPCSFRNFDVEESHQCSLDWLMLGPAAPPRQEAFRLCGSAIPPAFISARDHVWIFFHSDASSSGQAQGFRLSYIRGNTNGRARLWAPQGWGWHPPSAPSPQGLPQYPTVGAQCWDRNWSHCCLGVP